MDIREKNGLNAVTSFFIGLAIVIYLIPVFFTYPSYRFNVFLNSFFYIDLELLFLAITLFFFSYFMLRPVKTLKGRKILFIGVMSFGGVLLVFPLIGIGLILFDFFYFFQEGFLLFLLLITLIFLLAMLIPGVLLIIYGWYLRKNLRSDPVP